VSHTPRGRIDHARAEQYPARVKQIRSAIPLATDRAFRIGQKKNVLVHKFVCRGTVEERIDALIESKPGLSDALLAGGGEISLTEMTDEALMQLVALDLNAATKD